MPWLLPSRKSAVSPKSLAVVWMGPVHFVCWPLFIYNALNSGMMDRKDEARDAFNMKILSKIFTVLFFVPLLIVVVGGTSLLFFVRGDFFPSDYSFDLGKLVVFFSVFVFFVCALLIVFNKDLLTDIKPAFLRNRPIALSALALLAFITATPVRYSVAYLYGYVMHQFSYQQENTVSLPVDSVVNSLACPFGVTLLGAGISGERILCGFEQSVWQRIKLFTKVEVSGVYSRYGFDVKEFSVVENNK